MSTQDHHLPTLSEFRPMFFRLLGPEHRFYKLVLVYSIAISLLTLAIPISVQALIDTIDIRLGANARGWILLDTVSLGFELWRLLNNFPPVNSNTVASAQ